MPRRRKARGSKDPFSELDDEFKGAIQGAKTDDEIRRRMAKIAAAQEDNLLAQKRDGHLKECRDAAKEAGAQYREATKFNRLRTQFCVKVLRDRGKEP
jgi:hypothetical protein